VEFGDRRDKCHHASASVSETYVSFLQCVKLSEVSRVGFLDVQETLDDLCREGGPRNCNTTQLCESEVHARTIHRGVQIVGHYHCSRRMCIYMVASPEEHDAWKSISLI